MNQHDRKASVARIKIKTLLTLIHTFFDTKVGRISSTKISLQHELKDMTLEKEKLI